jgi:hypothetical protein
MIGASGVIRDVHLFIGVVDHERIGADTKPVRNLRMCRTDRNPQSPTGVDRVVRQPISSAKRCPPTCNIIRERFGTVVSSRGELFRFGKSRTFLHMP